MAGYVKITEGYVKQTFDEEGNCISQEFVAGDCSEYENQDGESIEAPKNENYQPYDMEQPNHSVNIESCREQIQEDLITHFDGDCQNMLDKACQIVVDNFNKFFYNK